ncbi:MAG: hypothetical protein NW224_16585 [Leptolyngbyaceae cyanobacterium bins.302]|nr:hypothetical protein [Leptolyngbyaceae cyanobacterium bins.302]
MVQSDNRQGVANSSMGAVPVPVKLTNAIDEELLRRGLLNPNRLKSYETIALVDTGAVRTVLPEVIVRELNLTIRGQQTARYADGREVSVSCTREQGYGMVV